MAITQANSNDTPTQVELTLEKIDDWYQWDAFDVYQLDELLEDIAEAETKDPGFKRGETTWYSIMKAHIRPGNSKISDNTLIWSISPATDCPHLNGEQCQVPKDACYAYKAEVLRAHTEDSPGGPLDAKRRQTVIWDLMDADTFADVFLEIVDRSTKEIEYLRLNEAGDIRHYHDMHKVNQIAKRLKQEAGIQLYLYSATYMHPETGEAFEWIPASDRHFTLMASNDSVEPHADMRFRAKFPENVKDDDVLCPAEENGRDNIKCGECLLCPMANEHNIDEVVVVLH